MAPKKTSSFYLILLSGVFRGIHLFKRPDLNTRADSRILRKKPMNISLGRIVILVNDYDEAFTFYNRVLNCYKIFDQTAENGQRFLHIGFNDDNESGIWFLKAETDAQKARVGKQMEGQPLMVLYTDNFEKTLDKLRREKVNITKGPVKETDFQFLHFLDLYGNEIVMVELVD